MSGGRGECDGVFGVSEGVVSMPAKGRWSHKVSVAIAHFSPSHGVILEPSHHRPSDRPTPLR
jgi:hypothetical protein